MFSVALIKEDWISFTVIESIIADEELIVDALTLEKLASVGKGSVTEIVFPFNVIPVPAINSFDTLLY